MSKTCLGIGKIYSTYPYWIDIFRFCSFFMYCYNNMWIKLNSAHNFPLGSPRALVLSGSLVGRWLSVPFEIITSTYSTLWPSFYQELAPQLLYCIYCRSFEFASTCFSNFQPGYLTHSEKGRCRKTYMQGPFQIHSVSNSIPRSIPFRSGSKVNMQMH